MFGGQITRRLCESTTNKMSLLSLEGILSARDKCMENIRNLPPIPIKIKDPNKRAAVLIPLCANSDGQVSMLYTLRSSNLKSHSGQVSFPGGKCDLTDGTMTNTALRETEEELGISRDLIEVWGEFNGVYPSRNYDMGVTPVVGLIRNYDRLKLKPNESEVEEVFTVPLEKMCDRQYFGFQTFKNGYVIPVFMAGEHKIWGLTSLVTHIFLSCLLPESAYPMAFQHIGIPDNIKAKL